MIPCYLNDSRVAEFVGIPQGLSPNILGGQRRVTASFLRADGGALHVRKATRPEPELLALYKALNLEPLPGGVQKTYV
jgi:hypothetical protein